MTELMHGKTITTVSYYEGTVASTKQEIEQSLYTNRESILKDVIEALAVINGGSTSKLELCVQVDKQGRYRLIKKWLV